MTQLSTRQLAETVTILQKISDPDTIYEAILDLLRSVVVFDAATLFERDRESGELVVVHQYGDQIVDLAPEAEFDTGNGLSSWICRQKTPVILESIEKSRAGRDHQINSFVALPLWTRDEFSGVLNFSHHEPGQYLMEMNADFQVVGNYLALAMERIQLHNMVRLQNDQLRETLRQLEAAQQKLIEKERLAAVGEIVVTVNHEINNPLTAIMGAAELAQANLRMNQPDNIERHLLMILKSANRIQAITQKITALKKTQTIPYIDEYSMMELPSD
ncbi:MAG: GAF domain-containing protein [FCB group bacterium]|nr:GAF domain-containing protein [FCB group bacterium]